jgi:hypothetical protein
MPAVPRNADALLTRLEAVRHERPGAREAERRLRAAARIRFEDAARLIRFHDAVLFLRAFPHSRGVLAEAERILSGFVDRVARLPDREKNGEFDAPEVAGIAGTTIGTDFSFELARWLAARYPRSTRIDWDAGVEADRMRASWPEFLPLLEEEALADANVPYLEWLRAAAGVRAEDPRWVLPRYARMPPSDRAERWDSLGVPISWELGRSAASRTRMRRPGPRAFFHDAPLLSRRDVSLERVFAEPPLAIRRLSRREGESLCDAARAATAARYREFYTFTHADPRTVLAARPGRGVELFLFGVRPERRLPLRAAYGGFVVKNAVPIGYIEGLAFFERLEIGFNVYYTFRDGESAWIYAQVLRFHRDALGVTSFSIDPYQLGRENTEAIESGAFWFYRKLGFRPTDPEIARLLAREERRIARDPAYRSTPATLRRLVRHNLLYEAPGSRRGEWDRFHVRRIGLAAERRMARVFGGDAEAMRRAAESRLARALGLEAPRGSTPLLRDVAVALDLVPDLERWPPADREAVAGIVREKLRGDERTYLRLMQGNERLRRAMIGLGSGVPSHPPGPSGGGRGQGRARARDV